jgi:tripartite ATP-independent transporter DctP family solute receptor
MKAFQTLMAIAVLVLLVGLGAGQAADKQIIITAADVVSAESHLGKSMDFFAQKLEEYSGGKVKVEVYHGGSLGGERDILENVKGGSIHIAAPGGGVLGIFYRPAEIFTFPYLFKDRAHADRVWAKLLPEFSTDLEKESGFKGLAIWNRPARNLSASKPVHKVEDMKGLKVRVPNTTMWVGAFKRFGASPTPMAFPEVYTALKTRVIDGQDNPIVLTYASGFFEVNKYYSLIRHMYQDNLLVTSSAYFNGLPADIQQAFLKAAADSNEYCRNLSLQEEERLMKAAKEKYGVEFIEPDLSGFRAAVEGFIDEFPHVQKWYEKAKQID